jgi:hypothetical protein
MYSLATLMLLMANADSVADKFPDYNEAKLSRWLAHKGNWAFASGVMY